VPELRWVAKPVESADQLEERTHPKPEELTVVQSVEAEQQAAVAVERVGVPVAVEQSAVAAEVQSAAVKPETQESTVRLAD